MEEQDDKQEERVCIDEHVETDRVDEDEGAVVLRGGGLAGEVLIVQ